MRILGIDPGLQKTGWGIVDISGVRIRFVTCGLIKPQVNLPLAQRLATLHTEIQSVIKSFQPDAAAVEETFVNKNPASALKLGQARGVVLAAPAVAGLPVFEYTANQIKKTIVGRGHAAKEQIGMMVNVLLPQARRSDGKALSHDEADALAIAICHAHHVGSVNQTQKAVS